MKNFTFSLATGIFLFFLTPASAQNNALNFDGTDDRIIVPPNDLYDFEYGTVEMWVRPQGLVGNTCLIANRSFGGTRFSFHMSPTQIGLYDGYGYGAINYATNAGEWYHIAFACTPSQTLLYVNGNPIGLTNTVIQGWENNWGEWGGVTGQELSIGSVRDNGGAYEHFKGDIDDIRIWNYTRNQAEISSQKDLTLTGSETGLVALFKFDEGVASGNNTGLTTVVESAIMNDGYLVNFALSASGSNFVNRFTTLPVELHAFTAARQNKGVLLQWQTASEQNSQSFVIERSSDGNRFTAIGTVAASHSSNSNKLYSFRDELPLNGANFYRLKMVDVDAKFSYSDTRAINFTSTVKLNWHSLGRNVVVNLPGGSNESYMVTNMSGAVVMRGRLEGGRKQITMPAAGVYSVQVAAETGNIATKIVIQ